MKHIPEELKEQVRSFSFANPEVSYAKLAIKFGVNRHSVSYWVNGGTTRSRKVSRRVWQKERTAKAKSVLIQFLGGCCYQCGYRGCDAALDFHHRDPEEKEHAISNLFTGNFDRAVEEASKCVLLCCRCHREKHSEEASLGPNKMNLAQEFRSCVRG